MTRKMSRWINCVCGNLILLLAFLLITPANAKPPASPASPQTPQATKDRIQATFLKAPLHFETNQGQTDGQVKFLARGSGYTMFLTATEAVLVLRKATGNSEGTRRKAEGSAQQEIPTQNYAESVVRMKLVGANTDPEMKGLEQLPGKVNYFLGNEASKWRTNIPTYKRIEYEDVYPGVNLVFYGNQRQLEYDFVVSPGAVPSAIKLAFEGADKIEVDTKGDLILRTALGDLRLHKPLVYQEIAGVRKPVSAAYILNPESWVANSKFKTQNSKFQSVGFQVAAYDTNRPLIIDPVLSYSTYLGGSGDDSTVAIAVDSFGNAYVTGNTISLDFPTANPFQAFKQGDIDVFVTKLNADGSALLYSTYLGGNGYDSADGIAVDLAGSAYVTGGTNSTDFPTSNPVQASKAGDFDAFVTKLNSTGSALVYSTYIGGSGYDYAADIAVDPNGNAYVTGDTQSGNFPTVNAFQPAHGSGLDDGFVTKVNSSGTALVYSTYLGGHARDVGVGIAVDGAGNGYVTGSTASTNFPTLSPLQAGSGGGEDAFVTKLDPSGSRVYSTYLGGSSVDVGMSIEVNSSGDAYVTGVTGSTNFPTINPFQAAHAGGGAGIATGVPEDVFVARLNASGSALIYSTYLGGGGDEMSRDIAVDSFGNAYVTGQTTSTNFPTANPFQATYGGGTYDAFVTKYDPAGTLVFSSFLGGSNDDIPRGIAVDASSNVYVTGATRSTDFPTANPFQPFLAAGGDAFVAKITDMIQVSIDIKPGSFPNSINLSSRGNVPVAVLSTATFDARTVDPTTVTLAGAPVRSNRNGRLMASFEDVNGDGLLDLVVHVSTSALQLSETDEEAVLEGKTSDGIPIRGKDTVRVVP